MRFARIFLWTALLCATTPVALRAQARPAPRCADGTTAETRYTACWFHGGVVVADSKTAKPVKAATPTRRVATPRRPASSKVAAPSTRRSPEAAPQAKRATATNAKAKKATAKKAAPKVVRPQKAPKGATALCKDGTYTDNKKPKKGCKKHDGVARIIAPSAKR